MLAVQLRIHMSSEWAGTWKENTTNRKKKKSAEFRILLSLSPSHNRNYCQLVWGGGKNIPRFGRTLYISQDPTQPPITTPAYPSFFA